MSLFEAIDGFEEYDEEILLKKHRRAPFVKHFAAHKSYLYDAILKALREYNEENIMEWQIREHYYKLKLLASKGLDVQCLKLIEKPSLWHGNTNNIQLWKTLSNCNYICLGIVELEILMQTF